jgi:hypothetical protein
LGIEFVGKRIRFGEDSTMVEIILKDAAPIHPHAQALVTDELDDTNSLIDSEVLLSRAIQLILVE